MIICIIKIKFCSDRTESVYKKIIFQLKNLIYNCFTILIQLKTQVTKVSNLLKILIKFFFSKLRLICKILFFLFFKVSQMILKNLI